VTSGSVLSASGFDHLPFPECKTHDNNEYDNSVNSFTVTNALRGSNVLKSSCSDFGKGLVIAHCNINGIKGKFEEIRELLHNHKFLFLGISETKLDINDSFFHSQLRVTRIVDLTELGLEEV